MVPAVGDGGTVGDGLRRPGPVESPGVDPRFETRGKAVTPNGGSTMKMMGGHWADDGEVRATIQRHLGDSATSKGWKREPPN